MVRSLRLIGLVLVGWSTGHAQPSARFNFAPGKEYTYKVRVQRQWRGEQFQNLPNWTGEMKIWPIGLQPDGRMLLRARLGMNPDLPGTTHLRDATVCWTRILIDPTGKPVPYTFLPRTDEAPTVRLTFPQPPSAGSPWQTITPSGAIGTYRLAQGSSFDSPQWEIDVAWHSPRYETTGAEFRDHISYDSKQGRVTGCTSKSNYSEGLFVWETITATFLNDRQLPSGEKSQIDHDSALLVDAVEEFDRAASLDDPGDNLPDFKLQGRKVISTFKNLSESLQYPAFARDLADVDLARYFQNRIAQAEASAKAQAAFLNKPSPAWAAQDAAGHAHALKDYRGKIVLLDFWSHTCGPCLLSMPVLNRIGKDYAQQPFVILGMNTGDSPDVITRTSAIMQLTNTQLQAGSVGRLYDVRGIPAYVFIDGDGSVRWKHVGWDDPVDKQLRAELDRLLKTRSVSSAQN